jgi:8-oxo-dGTP diphosphatase
VSGKYTYEYPRPAVNMWALPGGFIEMEETLEDAARRELLEETSIKAGELIRFDTYDKPKRDPRGRTITQVFILLWNPAMGLPLAGSDAKSLAWHELTALPELAFDHDHIIGDVIQIIRTT